MSNSDNPRIGAEFQKKVKDWFNANYGNTFSEEVKIPIGAIGVDRSEYKDHKFDVVSKDLNFVIECKCYTWTDSGNVPSAKMGTMNEAAFYLSLLPPSFKKLIVMLDCKSEKRSETLAQYYLRTYRHLLGDIVVAEFDPKTERMNFLNGIYGRNRKELINSFAVKYINMFSGSTDDQFINKSMAKDCFMLGFEMDCGQSFSRKYGYSVTADYDESRGFKEISNVDILGSGIFSKWRYITHWSYEDSCLTTENRKWFIKALTQLKKITD